MWLLIIGVAWGIGTMLLVLFFRGAAIVNQGYDRSHDIAIHRALNAPLYDFGKDEKAA